jgi:hypothetical protein
MRGKRDYAIRIHSTDRGFKADDATERSGNSDGTSGVRADAAETEASGDGRGRAATGAAGDARDIPRIMDGTVVRVVGCDAVGEFVHVGLAKKNGAGFKKLSY